MAWPETADVIGSGRVSDAGLPPSSTIRAKAGSVKPVRPLTNDPPCRALPLRDLAARTGSCTDASFRAVFRYPVRSGLSRAARPDEWVFPPARVMLWSHSRARAFTRPTALMGFGPSQV